MSTAMQHQSVALELPSCSHLQRRRRAERPSVSSTNTGDQPVLPEFPQGQSNDPGPWPCITVDPETQVRRALFTARNAEHMPSSLLLVCTSPRQPDRAQSHICAPGWGQPLAVGYEGTSNNVTSIMFIGAWAAPPYVAWSTCTLYTGLLHLEPEGWLLCVASCLLWLVNILIAIVHKI